MCFLGLSKVHEYTYTNTNYSRSLYTKYKHPPQYYVLI